MYIKYATDIMITFTSHAYSNYTISKIKNTHKLKQEIEKMNMINEERQ